MQPKPDWSEKVFDEIKRLPSALRRKDPTEFRARAAKIIRKYALAGERLGELWRRKKEKARLVALLHEQEILIKKQKAYIKRYPPPAGGWGLRSRPITAKELREALERKYRK